MHDKWKLQRAIGRAKTIVKAASGWKLELQSGLSLGLHWIRYSKGQNHKEEATLNPRKTAKCRYPQNLQCSRTYLLGPYDTTGRVRGHIVRATGSHRTHISSSQPYAQYSAFNRPGALGSEPEKCHPTAVHGASQLQTQTQQWNPTQNGDWHPQETRSICTAHRAAV